MSSRAVRVGVGVLVVACGAVLVATPEVVRAALGRRPQTPSDWINLRATFGGTLVGVGAFVAWLPAMRPWRRALLGLIAWSMAGIAAARLVGFALDGHPDGRQYVWLVAELVLASGGAHALRRRRGG